MKSKNLFVFLFISAVFFSFSCSQDRGSITNPNWEGLYIGDVRLELTGITSRLSVSILKSSGDDYNIILQGLVPLKGGINGNRLTVLKQIVSGSGSSRAEWEGNGTFNGNELDVVLKNFVGGVAGETYKGKLKR